MPFDHVPPEEEANSYRMIDITNPDATFEDHYKEKKRITATWNISEDQVKEMARESYESSKNRGGRTAWVYRPIDYHSRPEPSSASSVSMPLSPGSSEKSVISVENSGLTKLAEGAEEKKAHYAEGASSSSSKIDGETLPGAVPGSSASLVSQEEVKKQSSAEMQQRRPRILSPLHTGSPVGPLGLPVPPQEQQNKSSSEVVPMPEPKVKIPSPTDPRNLPALGSDLEDYLADREMRKKAYLQDPGNLTKEMAFREASLKAAQTTAQIETIQHGFPRKMTQGAIESNKKAIKNLEEQGVPRARRLGGTGARTFTGHRR